MSATRSGRFGLLGLTLLRFVVGLRIQHFHRGRRDLPTKAFTMLPWRARAIIGGAVDRLSILSAGGIASVISGKFAGEESDGMGKGAERGAPIPCKCTMPVNSSAAGRGGEGLVDGILFY